MRDSAPISQPSPLVDYFDSLAPDRERWMTRNRYYHEQLVHYFSLHIPANHSVLEIGSGTGQLLAALKPNRGLGIDMSPAMAGIAQKNFPQLEFRIGNIENLTINEKFDYVVLSDLIGFLYDVQACFKKLHQVCHPRTRIVLSFHNALWEPLLGASERLGLKAKQPVQNWLGNADLANLLDLAGYEVVRKNNRILIPRNIPLLASFCNKFLVNFPVLRHLALTTVLVARPKARPALEPPSVSVVIPARNEAGNIEAAVQRIPDMGGQTEIIFVEGNSRDNTGAEIKRVIAAHPERRMKFVAQGTGHGKGDAVRKGFAAASGDILMILDADLTVEPEELPKFYEAIVSGQGEFIHGSRLVYPMDKEAMRFLNMLGNKFFSLAFSYLLDQRFKDTLCGTKVLYRKDYEQVAANRWYFGDFDPFGDYDLIFGAAKLNLKIVEIPIHYRERTYGTTNISRFRHGALLLQMCLFAMRKIKFV